VNIERKGERKVEKDIIYFHKEKMKRDVKFLEALLMKDNLNEMMMNFENLPVRYFT
jgi:hypothetical protein